MLGVFKVSAAFPAVKVAQTSSDEYF